MRSVLSLGRVEHRRAGVDVARVDAEERELADERVGHDLEDESREGRVVVGLALELGAHVVVALDRRDVERRREVVDDRVEQLLHALVLEGRAADDRLNVAGDRGRAAGLP